MILFLNTLFLLEMSCSWTLKALHTKDFWENEIIILSRCLWLLTAEWFLNSFPKNSSELIVHSIQRTFSVFLYIIYYIHLLHFRYDGILVIYIFHFSLSKCIIVFYILHASLKNNFPEPDIRRNKAIRIMLWHFNDTFNKIYFLHIT